MTPSGTDVDVWIAYRGRCVVCLEPATAIHEIKPRSLNPKHWMEMENRVPLCAHHHEEVHRLGTHNVAEMLREKARSALRLLD